MTSSGTRLGPYRIVDSLGAGGMGEVWRAVDTRLGRDVAIKVLPERFAADQRFVERFDREARAISSLNHPNICALYDVGSDAGAHYLVMEILEGESLAERLRKGPLPLPEVLRYGAEIASALHAAHRRGITHRDLKPGNVILTASGAKLVDFGLAKPLADAAWDVEGLTDMPTEDKPPPLTREGSIVGTPPYMAPEQLQGGQADARTDIFALGAVLYEMATGYRPFEGKSAAALTASILAADPEPIANRVPGTPPALDHLVRTCLQRDPDRRWQSARDIATQLEWIGERGGRTEAAVATPPRTWREWLPWGVAAVLLAVVIGAALRQEDGSVGARPLARLSILPPEGMTIDFARGMSISPDGSRVIFFAGDERSGRLYLRSLDELDATPVTGSEGAVMPFWSPDSRHIGFFVDGKLKRIAASGGLAQTVCVVESPRGGAWGANGTIVFGAGSSGSLRRVSAGGGTPEPLTFLDESRGEVSHRWPSFLSDGEHLLFCSQTAEGTAVDDESSIEVVSLKTRERRRLLGANSSVQYVPSGHILFWRDGALVAQRFDAGTLTVSGTPIRLVDGVGYSRYELGAFSASREGTLVYQGGGLVKHSLVWTSFEGERLGTVGESGFNVRDPALSSDGTRVAYVSSGDVWVTDLRSGESRRLNDAPGDQRDLVWSPGDVWIAFSTALTEVTTHRQRSSGVGDPELLYADPDGAGLFPAAWTPDGAGLIGSLEAGSHISAVRLDLATGDLETLIDSPFRIVPTDLSPDGRWLAGESDETGRWEVYVWSLADPRYRRQISTGGGTDAQWSRDGKTIYYLEPASGRVRLMAVAVATPSLEIGSPVGLMTTTRESGDPFAVSDDETRVLWIMRPEGFADSPPLTVVRNWELLLER
ncbi:MAG TPA: protein kinase [Thermoanaerobaculia bacterium]|nr:protein kinase [Thermoanaerobaculia bacterium]